MAWFYESLCYYKVLKYVFKWGLGVSIMVRSGSKIVYIFFTDHAQKVMLTESQKDKNSLFMYLLSKEPHFQENDVPSLPRQLQFRTDRVSTCAYIHRLFMIENLRNLNWPYCTCSAYMRGYRVYVEIYFRLFDYLNLNFLIKGKRSDFC